MGGSAVYRRAAALALAALLGGCGGEPEGTACRLGSGGTVLAVGDSITRGYGADGNGYVEQLQGLLRAAPGREGVKVLNRGIDGERTEGLLARLDALLAETRPAVVLITIGGNDLLRRTGEQQTRANLRAILARVREAGAHPVLFAVPKPTLAAAAGLGSDHPMYREVAEAGEAEVLEGVVGDVLAEESLRSDTIHPNAEGYARMASAAYEAISDCR